jgi:hypothetical protein
LTAPGGHSPAHAAGPPVEPDDRRATIAGAVLVVAAVLVGILLLAKGFAGGGGVTTTSKKSSATTTTAASNRNTTSTTAAIDPASVHVYVANASGKTGAASRVAQVLSGKGYPAPVTGNAATTAATVVYYTSGQKAQAELVAQSLGLSVSSVAPMPSPAPVANLQGATVLVMIGTDGALDGITSGNGTTSTSARNTTSSTARSTTTTKKP